MQFPLCGGCNNFADKAKSDSRSRSEGGTFRQTYPAGSRLAADKESAAGIGMIGITANADTLNHLCHFASPRQKIL